MTCIRQAAGVYPARSAGEWEKEEFPETRASMFRTAGLGIIND